MFLYMVAELSALQQITTALTGIDGLRFIIVEVLTTTFYTSLGGFKISFITDNIQGAMVIGLSLLPTLISPLITRNNLHPVIICTITIGIETKIEPNRIESSGLTKTSLLGWQLGYILPVAVLTNDFFLSNFWIRTFASKTDEDLWIGVLLATVGVFIILTLVGSTGLIAVWSGVFDPSNPDQDASIAFFYLLENLPAWTVAIVLVMVVTLSTAAFDSLQSAMVSTASNDLFRNKLNIWCVRLAVVLTMIPVVLIAVKAPSILQIYLITDLISASMIPVLVIGLHDFMDLWSGFEVIVGGMGGLFTVFIFGTIYYGNAKQGIRLLLLEDGLYTGDWSVFGAFVAAPVGGILWGLGAFSIRMGYELFRSFSDGVPLNLRDRQDHSLPTTPSIHCLDSS
ncbi:hypothetical protein K3495_g7257 [Podosphaera aphanis]|nr:hypothetical protein K3495_g7257 [Podosphaera aphanis]